MKKIFNRIKSWFISEEEYLDQHIAESHQDMKRYKDRFIKAMKIEGKINWEIGEMREWKDVGIDRTNLNPFGFDIFYLSKEKLVETLGHCYITLDKISKELKELKNEQKKNTDREL